MTALARYLRQQHLALLTLLLVLAGGSAYAAGHHVKLPKNSVASKQVKNDSLRGKDIKDGTLTAADLAPGTVPSIPSITSFASTMPVDGQFRDVHTIATWGTLQARCTAGTVALRYIPQGGVRQAEWIRLESAGSEFSDSKVVTDQTPVTVVSTIDFGDSRLFV